MTGNRDTLRQSKPLGLLAGTSWPSTIPYYKLLNEKAAQTFGEGHSADLVIRSISYFELRSSYTNDWSNVKRLLKHYLMELDSYHNFSGILICNNTLHKAYDQLVTEGLQLNARVFHIIDAMAWQAKLLGVSKVLLLGTKFTMEDGFYAAGLEREGLEVVVPNETERNEIQEIQTAVANGQASPLFEQRLGQIITSYGSDADGVALACTELPLVVDQETSGVPTVSCIDAHVEFAWEQMA